MSSNYSVSLTGPAPWGFRLQGGKDFNMPLTISRLTDAGKAAKAGIGVGDMVLSIDGISTDGMNHLEAQNKIKACTGNLNLSLQRYVYCSHTDKSLELVKPVPIAHPHPADSAFTSSAPSATYNKTTQPFGGSNSNSAVVTTIPSASSAFTPTSSAQSSPPHLPYNWGGSVSAPSHAPPTANVKPSLGHVHYPAPTSPARNSTSSSAPVPPHPSVYNTPINLYSNENACEVAMGQRRGLLESQGGVMNHNGVPRKHVVETDIEFYHVPSHSKASKKRLMQDTEDWRPRTGTSQSRSFRILAQITGTENGESCQSWPAHQSHAEVVDEAVSCAQITSPVKIMTKSPAAGPQHANSFTVRQTSNFGDCVQLKPGAQKGPVMAKGPGPARPAPQPHPKDEDSLVQRAEHVPAGTRTPMCNHCNMVIRGPFLVAMGKSWHPEEFNCAHCSTSLVDLGFVEENGAVYCEYCYEEFLAPTCARCQHKILGEVINALKQTWHVCCFLCASCQQPLHSNTFHLEDGEPYCESDYYRLFGTSCHGCEFPIEAGDKFLEALGYTWHDTCFVCAVCCTSLEGQTFFTKKDKPLCKKHAHSVNI
ncbi:PDZ and LIM domain protein 5 [Arapaima gigas]